MTINNYFNINRFYLSIKNEILRNARTYLLTLGAIAGILTSFDMLPGLITGSTMVPTGTYYPIFFGLGLVFSSTLFTEMHDPQKGMVFLTTPASNLEKFISKLLVSTVLYIVVMVLFFQLLTVFLNGFNTLLFDAETSHFSFNWTLVRFYLIYQSIFMFASSFFKKYAFIKLLFASFLLQLFFSLYSIVGFKILFDIQNFSNISPDIFNFSFGTIADFIKNSFYTVRFVYMWLVAPFFWFMTYLRMIEKEI